MWGALSKTGRVACVAMTLLGASAAVRAAEIRNLRIWAGPEYTRAVFDVSGPTDYKLFELAKPDRIVLDRVRLLSYQGRDLIAGFGDGEQSKGGKGQLLAPWPNRIRDGRYEFGGKSYQLGLTEVARNNASHGLVRWAQWLPIDEAKDSITLATRLMAQSGYPWTLDLEVTYAIGPDGLTVTQSATNHADSPAPYAAGAHPYLTAGAGTVDDWTLTLPARTRLLSDPERKLPTGSEPTVAVYEMVLPATWVTCFTLASAGNGGRSILSLSALSSDLAGGSAAKAGAEAAARPKDRTTAAAAASIVIRIQETPPGRPHHGQKRRPRKAKPWLRGRLLC